MILLNVGQSSSAVVISLQASRSRTATTNIGYISLRIIILLTTE